jgi:hypothetical protein
MRKALVAVVGLTVLAAAANAASIRLFLSTSSDVTALPSTATPAVAPGSTLYIWAQHNMYEGLWNGLSIGFNGPVSGAQLYNPNMGPTSGSKGAIWSDYMKFRWQNGAVTSPAPGNPPLTTILPDPNGALNASAVSGAYLLSLGAGPVNIIPGAEGKTPQDTLAITDYILATDTWTGWYKLGQVTVNGAPGSQLKLMVGSGWDTAVGGTANDLVYLGFGDAAVSGRQTGAVSELADATIIPEPASLVLLALAGLMFRRR